MTIVPPAPPAATQVPSLNMITEPSVLTEEEKQKRAEQEKAYQEQLGKIPDQKANNDPWGKVRSAERRRRRARPRPRKISSRQDQNSELASVADPKAFGSGRDFEDHF
jgi:hypothetical protein